jgi:predicted ribosome quality control (RQC) complex YloA/Tae2 family protein
MAFDGFFIHHLINELNGELSRGRLEKVQQKDDTRFLFTFYQNRTRKRVVFQLESNLYSVYITTKDDQAQKSSQFLAALKKHLEGAILKGIEQYLTDRVLIWRFLVHDFINGPTEKQLIFEAMGRHSNLILVGEDRIIDCFKRMHFETGRQLLPLAPFAFFKAIGKPFTEIDYSTVEKPQDLVKNYLGISPLLASYLFENRLMPQEIELQPTKDVTHNKIYAFDIFSDQVEKKTYASLSELLDDRAKRFQISTKRHETFIRQHQQKLFDKRSKILESIDETKDKLRIKEEADLIYQSGHDLKAYFARIESDNRTIALDPTLTLNENAQKKYRIYHKAKRGLAHLKKRENEVRELIDLFETFKINLELSGPENIADFENELIEFGFQTNQTRKPGKKDRKKPSYLDISDGSARYLVGRNSHQNAYITHELAHRDDYWFHVKQAPGSHVVCQSETLDEQKIRTAAQLAAYHSKLRFSESIPVDYARVKHVRKLNGRPGYQVTYQNYKTIYIDIDEKRIIDLIKNGKRTI